METHDIKYQKLILGFGGSDNPLKHVKYYKDDVVVLRIQRVLVLGSK